MNTIAGLANPLHFQTHNQFDIDTETSRHGRPFRTRFLTPKAVGALACIATLSMSAFPQTADFSSLVSGAEAARQQGDASGAIALYQKLTEMNPAWPDGWWFLGTLEYDTNQYGPAQAALSRYLQLTPKAAPALALRGLCEFNTGQYPQSLADLEQAEALGAANQPRNAQIIYYHDALLLIHVGRYEEALGKLQILVQQAGENPDLLLALALAGLRQNRFPEETPPDQIEMLASVGKAAALVMNRDYDSGDRAFQALFSAYPRLPNLHYFYGYLLFAAKPEQAAIQFRDELSIAPDSANAHAMCAWALEMQGDYPASLADASKAAGEDPSSPMNQLVYGKALVETGDLEAGLPHLESVIESEPNNLEAHLSLVKAYANLGRSDEARRERLICLSISQQGAAPVAIR